MHLILTTLVHRPELIVITVLVLIAFVHQLSQLFDDEEQILHQKQNIRRKEETHMTELGLKYLSYEETKRSNVAREIETNRSNLANEKETNRSNVARETETNRHNLVTEKETKRSNVAKELETNRSNVAREAETHRANVAQEALKAEAQKEQKRHNIYTEAETKRSNEANELQRMLSHAPSWFKESVAISTVGRQLPNTSVIGQLTEKASNVAADLTDMLGLTNVSGAKEQQYYQLKAPTEYAAAVEAFNNFYDSIGSLFDLPKYIKGNITSPEWEAYQQAYQTLINKAGKYK